MIRSLALLIGVTTLTGCITGNEDFNRVALDKALATWDQNGPDSYSFAFTQQCTCQGPKTPVRIVVRNGVVESRTVVDTGEPLDPGYNAQFPPIPGVFGIVEDAMTSGSYSLIVEYDATYGYPVRIQIDLTPATVTDNAQYSVAEFTPLE
jgi:hypothetical protein